MTPQTITPIRLENLVIDLFNPRHVPQLSQREALATIARDQGIKLVNLAEDIVDKGLNPSELPLVAATDQEGIYTVLEGNRRIAALKLLSSPHLLLSLGLQKNLKDRYQALHKSAGTNIPTEIHCAVLSREDANHWIQLKHTGENDGVGIVTWDGLASQRFRGSSPALQAIELVASSDYIDEETRNKLAKIAITNVERLLGTPEARKALGVDVRDGHLMIVAPEEEALGRLAIVVSEVANKEIRVSDLDSKEQRVAYAERVASLPLPAPGTSTRTGATTTSSLAKSSTSRRIRPDRKMLIPRSLRLTIPHQRINQIFHELQRINVDDYTNCCAVMFRVFIELSVDHYAEKTKISLVKPPKQKDGTPTPHPKGMSLREKITTVAEHLEQTKVCSKDQLRGIHSLISNNFHVLSVDSLHAYVHNKDFYPTATDLKTNWDNVQPFVQGLWTT